MSSFSDPAGRRFRHAIYGSLIILTVGVVQYLLGLPGYEPFFCLFIVYVICVYIGFHKDQKQVADYVPWYASRVKGAVFIASVSILAGIVGILTHTSYKFDFILAAAMLIGAAVVHHRETRDKKPPTDSE